MSALRTLRYSCKQRRSMPKSCEESEEERLTVALTRTTRKDLSLQVRYHKGDRSNGVFGYRHAINNAVFLVSFI